ncbi:hypothetical protein T02_9819 [Trichinella nativa]|uniref:Uncharacterized protein n=3 Tax=Trichinella TaxID=6333 RepID=A0A0V1L4Z6_9BILA|nr:hypothetical protein T05_7081 [Trichinella murrelli]KRX84064.1 hypothetical protein T06_6729 [Trichinella sp. T6]KRY59730.1 hypothetical protein T03_4714 [Trichinella britovi]KRZ54627.1 hypothetical protein T02_9819 [Trichinella nativa]
MAGCHGRTCDLKLTSKCWNMASNNDHAASIAAAVKRQWPEANSICPGQM